ncbi:MAG: universal stress protein [Candidatus Rhabdochlamydia sp.]
MTAHESSQDQVIAQLDRGAFKRVLGVFDLFAIGYGDLGSSIYYALGITSIFALGSTPLSLLLAGLVFSCTALSYAEMTSIFHDSGGSASYTRKLFNDLISFIAGWGLLLDYIVTIAISAFTIGPYLMQFFPELKDPLMQIGVTVGIIALLLGINIYGVKDSARMSFFLMITTVLTQFLIIGIGLFSIEDFSLFFSQLKINQQGSLSSPTWSGFFKGTAMAMVAYTGVESIAQLSAETKAPAKTIPKAILITTCVLIFMYLGLSFVGFSLINPYQFGRDYEEFPIVGIVSHLSWGSSWLVPWTAILSAVTLFVAANAGLIGASRLSFNMGEHYQLPRFLYRLHSQFKTPYIALSLFASIAMIVVMLSQAKMSFLADLYNFGSQIAFFSTHVSLIFLRIKEPHLVRPFKAPLNIWIKGKEIPLTAIIGALSSLAVWILVVMTKPDGRNLGCLWLLVGVCMYFLYRKKQGMTVSGTLEIQKIKIPSLEPVKISQIIVPIKQGKQIEVMQVACLLAKLYHAKVLACHIIEVPSSLPLEMVIPHRLQNAAHILKIMEAIARDQEVDIEVEVIRARHFAEAIVDIVYSYQGDLVILGINSEGSIRTNSQKLLLDSLKALRCKVWFCRQ